MQIKRSLLRSCCLDRETRRVSNSTSPLAARNLVDDTAHSFEIINRCSSSRQSKWFDSLQSGCAGVRGSTRTEGGTALVDQQRVREPTPGWVLSLTPSLLLFSQLHHLHYTSIGLDSLCCLHCCLKST